MKGRCPSPNPPSEPITPHPSPFAPPIAARDSILTRLYGVFVGLLVLPALVVVQLVRIQMDEGAELRARGAQQSESVITLAAQRGTILDRRGRALAVNTARYEVAADPTAPGFETRAPELYALLGRLTGRGAEHFRQRVADRASRQYVVLVRDLDEASKEALDRADFGGLIVTGSYQRRYKLRQPRGARLGPRHARLAGRVRAGDGAGPGPRRHAGPSGRPARPARRRESRRRRDARRTSPRRRRGADHRPGAPGHLGGGAGGGRRGGGRRLGHGRRPRPQDGRHPGPRERADVRPQPARRVLRRRPAQPRRRGPPGAGLDVQAGHGRRRAGERSRRPERRHRHRRRLEDVQGPDDARQPRLRPDLVRRRHHQVVQHRDGRRGPADGLGAALPGRPRPRLRTADVRGPAGRDLGLAAPPRGVGRA